MLFCHSHHHHQEVESVSPSLEPGKAFVTALTSGYSDSHFPSQVTKMAWLPPGSLEMLMPGIQPPYCEEGQLQGSLRSSSCGEDSRPPVLSPSNQPASPVSEPASGLSGAAQACVPWSRDDPSLVSPAQTEQNMDRCCWLTPYKMEFKNNWVVLA